MGKRSAKRNYKDSLFRMVFREKKELLSLYNAINGTMYEDPEELVVTTIEDVLYMGRKNDISFLIKDVMNLYEHQSSVNPNMPLRGLIYICMLYQGYLEQNNLDIYSSTLLKLPTPKYLVFYNGTKAEPDRRELRLSDSFIKQEEPLDLECRAVVLNINYGHNKELMEACRKLYEYSRFVESIRVYLNTGMKLGAAMDQAIEDCIRLDILKELLLKHRGEVKQVILTEYNQERHAKTLLEEGRKQGREENAKLLQKAQDQYAKSIRQLLAEKVDGDVVEQDERPLFGFFHPVPAKGDPDGSALVGGEGECDLLVVAGEFFLQEDALRLLLGLDPGLGLQDVPADGLPVPGPGVELVLHPGLGVCYSVSPGRNRSLSLGPNPGIEGHAVDYLFPGNFL